MICTKRTIQRQLLSLSKTGLSRGDKMFFVFSTHDAKRKKL